MLVLTIEIFGDSDFRRKTISVERMTEVNGAAAETQKYFGHLMLCKNGFRLLFQQVINYFLANSFGALCCKDIWRHLQYV